VINLNYKKDLTINCKKNLMSLSDEYMLGITDATVRHIEELLLSLSKMLDNHLCLVNPHREPKMYKALSAQTLKMIMLSDLITKSAEEYESLDILKVLLEGVTVHDIFQEGDSVKIEVLQDNTLKISGEQTRGTV
jgi:hypothetical protein